MARQEWVIARTAEELAEALDLSPAEVHVWDFRIQLANRIAEEVIRRRLTHAEAAKLAGTSRSRMTAIVNGGSSTFPRTCCSGSCPVYACV